MSTRKLSDKEFDQYARNILKKPEGIAFDPAAWQQLDNMLERPASVGYLKYFIGLLVLLLFVGVYFISANYLLTEDSTSKMAKINSQTSNNQSTTGPEALNNTNSGHSTAQLFDTSTAATGASTTSKHSNDVVKPLEWLEPANSPFVSDNEVTQQERIKTAKDAPLITDESNREIQLIQFQPKENRQLFVGLSYLDIESQNEPEEIINNLDKKQTNLWDKISIGVTVAPDASTVGRLSEFDNIGLDLGVQIEYQIAPRLSITTGALLTRKIYRTTDISEYEIPPGFWTDGRQPNQIRADCRVIDIPLNLRYRVIDNGKRAFFIGAGVSSYLMLDEQYHYDYNNVYSGDLISEWNVSGENNHFFGVYNISFGIAQKITPQFFIEAEPYFKNSFGGVGWGNVNLRSTGVQFSLKYLLGKN